MTNTANPLRFQVADEGPIAAVTNRQALPIPAVPDDNDPSSLWSQASVADEILIGAVAQQLKPTIGGRPHSTLGTGAQFSSGECASMTTHTA
jgi:hypothetical protein